MAAYYNEIDPYAAAWLCNLMAAGHIAPGDVDERDIREVSADDLRGYGQCHFFAGIGGWSYALRLAGWPDDRPVFTGSPPCQPFSAAGKRAGTNDPRHLWPEFFRLIRECRPVVTIGEQVASAIGHGWLDGVSADLEGEGYAVGAVVLGAHSVGAPHIRQRLWFVANRLADAGCASDERGLRSREASEPLGAVEREARQRERRRADAGRSGIHGGLADAERSERGTVDSACRDEGSDGLPQGQEGSDGAGSGGEDGGLADPWFHRWGQCADEALRPESSVKWGREVGWMVNTNKRRRQTWITPAKAPRYGTSPGPTGSDGWMGMGDAPSVGREKSESKPRGSPEGSREEGGQQRPWDDSGLIPCADGKSRRIESGIQPLVARLPDAMDGLGPISRVGVLRGAGNSIIPQIAAVFIEAARDVT